MKIAYLCFDDGISIGSSKGAAVHVVSIANALVKVGHEVFVLAVAGEKGETHHDFDLKILNQTPIARRLVNLLNKFESITKIVSDLRMLIKLIDYRFTALRVLKHYHPEFLIERYSLFCINGIKIAGKLDVPIALEINGPAALEAKKWRNLVLTKLASHNEYIAFRSVDICFTVSKELNKYVSQVAGFSNHVVTLPNGVDTLQFKPSNSPVPIRSLFNIPLDATVIGYVGGFKEWHDVQSLIKAFQYLAQKNNQVYLFLVGSGPTHQLCEDLVRTQESGNRIIFTGSILPNHIPDYVAAIDIATAPFIPLEFFYFSPLKLFEYMAAGKCIVTSCIGQVEEIIKHQENGWLYTPGDVDGLVKGLNTLVNSPEMRHQFGLQAREWVEKNQTWNKNAEIITSHLGRCQMVKQQRDIENQKHQ